MFLSAGCWFLSSSSSMLGHGERLRTHVWELGTFSDLEENTIDLTLGDSIDRRKNFRTGALAFRPTSRLVPSHDEGVPRSPGETGSQGWMDDMVHHLWGLGWIQGTSPSSKPTQLPFHAAPWHSTLFHGIVPPLVACGRPVHTKTVSRAVFCAGVSGCSTGAPLDDGGCGSVTSGGRQEWSWPAVQAARGADVRHSGRRRRRFSQRSRFSRRRRLSCPKRWPDGSSKERREPVQRGGFSPSIAVTP